MLDDMLAVLANRHRRHLLVALNDQNPQTEVGTPDGVEVDGERLTALRLEMRHNHLPRLEDAGYIEWDQDLHVVTKGPAFDQIRPVLEMFEENAEELPVEWP